MPQCKFSEPMLETTALLQKKLVKTSHHRVLPGCTFHSSTVWVYRWLHTMLNCHTCSFQFLLWNWHYSYKGLYLSKHCLVWKQWFRRDEEEAALMYQPKSLHIKSINKGALRELEARGAHSAHKPPPFTSLSPVSHQCLGSRSFIITISDTCTFSHLSYFVVSGNKSPLC